MENQTKKFVLIGAGGHARVLLDTLRRNQIEPAGFVDAKPHGAPFHRLNYLGNDDYLTGTDSASVVLANGIGSIPHNAQARIDAFRMFSNLGFDFPSITHPLAIVSEDSSLAPGVQIFAGSVLQPGTVIGENSIINTAASIDHDCQIGKQVHIAPNATLSGSVRVGDNSHIGAGAVLIQSISVGCRCIIGAGAIITQNVPDDSTVYPSRSTTKNHKP